MDFDKIFESRMRYCVKKRGHYFPDENEVAQNDYYTHKKSGN